MWKHKPIVKYSGVRVMILGFASSVPDSLPSWKGKLVSKFIKVSFSLMAVRWSQVGCLPSKAQWCSRTIAQNIKENPLLLKRVCKAHPGLLSSYQVEKETTGKQTLIAVRLTNREEPCGLSVKGDKMSHTDLCHSVQYKFPWILPLWGQDRGLSSIALWSLHYNVVSLTMAWMKLLALLCRPTPELWLWSRLQGSGAVSREAWWSYRTGWWPEDQKSCSIPN